MKFVSSVPKLFITGLKQSLKYLSHTLVTGWEVCVLLSLLLQIGTVMLT